MKAFSVAGWLLSVVGFVVVLFGTYKDLTPAVVVWLDAAAGRGLPLGRSGFFFGAVALFALGNGLFLLLAQLVPGVPLRWLRLPVGHYWRRTVLHRRALGRILTGWFFALASVFNFFLMVALVMIESGNHLEGDATTYPALLPVGGLLLLVVWVALPLRLRRRQMSLVRPDED